jgi:hypothetical protein
MHDLLPFCVRPDAFFSTVSVFDLMVVSVFDHVELEGASLSSFWSVFLTRAFKACYMPNNGAIDVFSPTVLGEL